MTTAASRAGDLSRDAGHNTDDRTDDTAPVEPIARYAWSVLAVNLAVIAWGAFVRATGSGAGCGSHWPLCNGEVIPRAPRIETLIEFSHRASTGIAGLAVFALTVWVMRTTSSGDSARRPAVAATLLMVTEALIGAALVHYGWVDQDASWGRVGALALHLINTFFLIAAIALTAWRVSGAPANRWQEGADGALVVTTLAMTLLVAVTGAITSLGDTLFPAASLAAGVRQDFGPTAHFLERLRVLHPVLAVFTAIMIIRGSWLLARRRPSEGTTRMAKFTAAVVLTQIGAGVLNLALRAPIAMQLVHLLIADVVWISILLLGATALATPPAADLHRDAHASA